MSSAGDGKGAIPSSGPSSGFRVSQIDHIHVYVRDQREAARWYGEVLGLEVFKDIDDADEGGPLVVSSDGGSTGLALFKKKSNDATARTRSTVAFRVGGGGFIDFLGRLASLGVEGENGQTLAPSDVVDHDYCYSLYFNDPDGNPYELTTYDYDEVREHLGRNA
jgi:catechol 2,3-dioxygenase-like lactoylglutathione lyase family enzyme